VHRIQEAQTTIYHVLWELAVAALRRPAGDGGPSGASGASGAGATS
jgi:D-sedoheptulose 7-phosphate isomerase